ncbi:MAG: hypothetical protein H7323_03090 [Frankiales bacterium]|nr:hypothetical protein [Frankiales bacterium]
MNTWIPVDELERARRECGLSARDLEHDQIAHSLNERFTELGRNQPVPDRRPDVSGLGQ